MGWAQSTGQGRTSSGSLGVSVVVLPHCFELRAPEEPGLAELLGSKGLLCSAASGMGVAARVERQPDGSLRVVPGEPNAWHRAGTS